MSSTDHSVGWQATPAEAERAELYVTALQKARSAIAGFQALEAQLLASAQADALAQRARCAASSEYDFPLRSMAGELAAAVREAPGAMAARMAEAASLVADFPGTWQALADGRIGERHARVIREAGQRLPTPEARATFEERVLPRAAEVTAGGLRAFVRVVADRLDPESFAKRHRRARARRGAFVRELEDGMAELAVVGPAVLVHGSHDRLTSMAKALIRDRGSDSSDTRTMDQVRADLACDLLLTGAPSAHAFAVASDQAAGAGSVGAGGAEAGAVAGGPTGARDAASGRSRQRGSAGEGDAAAVEAAAADALFGHDAVSGTAADAGALAAIRATVQVTIPARTLVGLDDEAAVLAGHGPADADTVRWLAATAANWQRLYVHPDTGALLTVDTYTPTRAQRRFLLARDERCRFPGCRVPARRGEHDHTVAWADGGETTVTNLAGFCKPHHRTKHHTPWRVMQRADGLLEWTSPTGRSYIDTPEPAVRFVATEALTATPPGITHPPPRPTADPPGLTDPPGTTAGPLPAADLDPPPF